MSEDKKRNHLTQKDFRRLGDWVLANRAAVEAMLPEAVAEAASSALGIVVTKANAIAACEVVEVLTAKETAQFTSAKVAELHNLIDGLRREFTAVRRECEAMLERIEGLEARELAAANKRT